MTQRSWFWGGTTVGDAALGSPYGAPYGDDMFTDVLASILTKDRTTQGIIWSSHATYSGNLTASDIGGDTYRMSAGMALVDGKLYASDANVDHALTRPGSGTNYYTLVLDKDWTAQTVRQSLLGPSSTAYPTPTQTDGTTWELPIAYFTITSAGAMTYTRGGWLYPAFGQVTGTYIANDAIDSQHYVDRSIDTAHIALEAVTAAEIDNRTRTFLVTPQSNYSNLSYGVALEGVVLADTGVKEANGTFIVPKDYYSGLTVTAVVLSPYSTGDVYVYHRAIYGAINEDYNTHSATSAYSAVGLTTPRIQSIKSLSLSSAAVDDVVYLIFRRDADNVLDTISDWIGLSGFLVSYTADS